MSLEVPENMEEVAMVIAREKVHGHDLKEDDVINDAVRDILQSYLDEALEGHYDDVKFADGGLIVTDIMDKEVATVQPEGENWVVDFKKDADALSERFADLAQQIVGHR